MANGLPRDPMLLLSVVNTKLRDYYHSLDALCDYMNVNKDIKYRDVEGAVPYEVLETKNGRPMTAPTKNECSGDHWSPAGKKGTSRALSRTKFWELKKGDQ